MYDLLQSQKNEVFKIIQEQELDPGCFSWVIGEYRLPAQDLLRRGLDYDKYEVPQLIYLDSPFYFKFGLLNGKHFCTFSPAKEMPFEEEITESWESQKGYLREWTNYLKREVNAPNLWAEMEKYKTSVSIALPESLLNEPIPFSEVEDISDRLSLLADRIEDQFKLTSEQDQFVRHKLNYLKEAAKRQRSADWVHTSIGVFITIAVGLAFAPDKAKELWQLFQNIFGGIIHLIGP